MACREVVDSARRQGPVLDASGIVGKHTDCILFLREQVVFIRIKRARSIIRSPEELVLLFSREIAGLRTIPLTPVVSRQIRVRLPWGTWQYFTIFDDRIVEIHPDTTNGTGAEKNAGGMPGQKNPVPIPVPVTSPCSLRYPGTTGSLTGLWRSIVEQILFVKIMPPSCATSPPRGRGAER